MLDFNIFNKKQNYFYLRQTCFTANFCIHLLISYSFRSKYLQSNYQLSKINICLSNMIRKLVSKYLHYVLFVNYLMKVDYVLKCGAPFVYLFNKFQLPSGFIKKKLLCNLFINPRAIKG